MTLSIARARHATRKALKHVIRRPLYLKNRVLVGTHHKTGTVWLLRIFDEISRKLDLIFVHSKDHPVPARWRWDIFHATHSQFDLERLRNCRGIHLVRDPRDMIVSAAFYHQTSSEKWLHVPLPEFSGLTYQQKINSYASFDDKLLFEMEHSSFENIRNMMRFDCPDGSFKRIKYEDLIDDRDLTQFEQMFAFLGFRDRAMAWCLAAARRNSLFGGAARIKHVRSGRASQWPEYFRPAHHARFDELFKGVLEQFNYDGAVDRRVEADDGRPGLNARSWSLG